MSWEMMWRWRKLKERATMWLVWRLPRAIVMWCAIRVAAHATTGRWSHQVVPDLRMMDAIKRWDESHD
jgi:hypothetical protein